jgi:hypothetical protein
MNSTELGPYGKAGTRLPALELSVGALRPYIILDAPNVKSITGFLITYKYFNRCNYFGLGIIGSELIEKKLLGFL